MIALIQRVTEARVAIGGETVGAIGRGILALVGVERGDTQAEAARLAETPSQDNLQLRRLKKRKLLLKDSSARLRDRLIPDIIA